MEGGLRMDRMMLLLKPSQQQEQELNRLIASQQDKQSPNFHRWLTPAEYAARFGPSSADVDQITGWLKQVTGSYAAPMQTIWVFLIIGVGAYLFLARQSAPQLR